MSGPLLPYGAILVSLRQQSALCNACSQIGFVYPFAVGVADSMMGLKQPTLQKGNTDEQPPTAVDQQISGLAVKHFCSPAIG